jgi:hypothetical protein
MHKKSPLIVYVNYKNYIKVIRLKKLYPLPCIKKIL